MIRVQQQRENSRARNLRCPSPFGNFALALLLQPGGLGTYMDASVQVMPPKVTTTEQPCPNCLEKGADFEWGIPTLCCAGGIVWCLWEGHSLLIILTSSAIMIPIIFFWSWKYEKKICEVCGGSGKVEINTTVTSSDESA